MADYGALLYDEQGRQVTRVDKENYHYWGRITVNPASGWQSVSLFNIPSSVPVALFVSATFGNGSNYANYQGDIYCSNSGGVWQFFFKRGPVYSPATAAAFSTCTIYVFVPGRYVRAGAYGLQCFSADGTKFFDSSRPLLQFCGFVMNAASSSSVASVSYFNRVPSRVASPMNNELSGDIFPFPNLNYHVRFIGCQTSLSNGYYWIWDYTLPAGTTGSTGKFRPTNVALIDCDYYETFPNEANW